MKKKTIALLLVLMMVFGVSVGGTVAYLMDTKTVTNTFTIGNVTITLDESLVTPYGELAKYVEKNDGSKEIVALADGETEKTSVTANSYKLIPGHTYTKDPTIHVGSTSEDCWLFVKIEIDAALKDAVELGAMTGWTAVAGNEGWYQYGDAAVAANANVPVFTTFTVKSDATIAQAMIDKTVKVTAYAVQEDNLSQSAAFAEIPKN